MRTLYPSKCAAKYLPKSTTKYTAYTFSIKVLISNPSPSPLSVLSLQLSSPSALHRPCPSGHLYRSTHSGTFCRLLTLREVLSTNSRTHASTRRPSLVNSCTAFFDTSKIRAAPPDVRISTSSEIQVYGGKSYSPGRPASVKYSSAGRLPPSPSLVLYGRTDGSRLGRNRVSTSS